MKEPIILYPPTTPEAVWKSCEDHVELCGGNPQEDGEVNWRAAFGADPGVVSCPGCHEMHWKYGRIHKCPTCELVYPTDWWPMYSWGSSAKNFDREWSVDEKRRPHPYWSYGFNHPVKHPVDERFKIDWRKEIGDCYKFGGEFCPVEDLESLCIVSS